MRTQNSKLHFKFLSLFLPLFLFLGNNTFAQLGTIDPTFNLGSGFGGGFTQSRVETTVQQADGKLLVGGWFTDYNGTTSNFIARLNLDGSFDNTFIIDDGFSGFSGYVKAIAIQADGKIVVGGNYLGFNGTTRHRIARLNMDGSLDLTFDPQTGFNSDVNAVAIQNDGKIIVAGIFSAYDWLNSGGISRPGIARLNTDGSLDNSFDPGNGFVSTTAAQARIHKLIIQPDGKILACGQFEEFNNTNRIIVVRLNANGSIDNSFDAGNNFQLIFGFHGEAWDMKLQPDGKILLAGNFSHVGASNSGVVRLNSDGSIDNTFMLNKKATSIGLQANGQIYVAETGPYNFNRHNTDGTLDTSFPQTTFNDIAQTIVVQNDGNILIGGWFSYNPSGMMRLIGDNSTTNVKHLNSSLLKVNLFPNPASKHLNINIEDLEFLDGVKLKLINSIGQVVQELEVNEAQMTFALNQMQAGLYVYQLENKRGILKTGKLIVE
jgi:uncharacterized delta-60 repeat protein